MKTEIILLRGLFRGKHHWGDFPEYLQEKFPDKTITCIDVAGNGDLSSEVSPHTITGMVESIRSQRKENTRVNIVAISMGAMIGLKWAEQYPKEVDSLICINTSTKGFSPFYERLLPVNYLKILNALISTPLKRETIIYKMVSNKKVDINIINEWASFAMSHPMLKMNFFRQLIAAMRFEFKPPECNLFFIASVNDRLVHFNATKAIAEALNAPLIINERDGHDIPLDNPQWLCQTLTTLIK